MIPIEVDQVDAAAALLLVFFCACRNTGLLCVQKRPQKTGVHAGHQWARVDAKEAPCGYAALIAKRFTRAGSLVVAGAKRRELR